MFRIIALEVCDCHIALLYLSLAIHLSVQYRARDFNSIPPKDFCDGLKSRCHVLNYNAKRACCAQIRYSVSRPSSPSTTPPSTSATPTSIATSSTMIASLSAATSSITAILLSLLLILHQINNLVWDSQVFDLTLISLCP